MSISNVILILAIDVTAYSAGGAAVSLLALAIGFNFRNQKSQYKAIENLKNENDVCHHQLGILYEQAVNHGWQIPKEYWNKPKES